MIHSNAVLLKTTKELRRNKLDYDKDLGDEQQKKYAYAEQSRVEQSRAEQGRGGGNFYYFQKINFIIIMQLDIVAAIAKSVKERIMQQKI